MLSNPLNGMVPNPSRAPSVTDEVFELLGVRCDADHHDAFAQLGLGEHRRTKDWLSHEA